MPLINEYNFNNDYNLIFSKKKNISINKDNIDSSDVFNILNTEYNHQDNWSKDNQMLFICFCLLRTKLLNQSKNNEITNNISNQQVIDDLNSVINEKDIYIDSLISRNEQLQLDNLSKIDKPSKSFSFFNNILVNRFQRLKIENEELRQNIIDNNIPLLVVEQPIQPQIDVVPQIVEIDKIIVEDNLIENVIVVEPLPKIVPCQVKVEKVIVKVPIIEERIIYKNKYEDFDNFLKNVNDNIYKLNNSQCNLGMLSSFDCGEGNTPGYITPKRHYRKKQKNIKINVNKKRLFTQYNILKMKVFGISDKRKSTIYKYYNEIINYKSFYFLKDKKCGIGDIIIDRLTEYFTFDNPIHKNSINTDLVIDKNLNENNLPLEDDIDTKPSQFNKSIM
jgi:hypothetical protein